MLVNAPPGWGKSRLLARLAAARRAAVLVRSHQEGLQILRYIRSMGGSASVAFGRAVLCPLGARDSGHCLRLREEGLCRARSTAPPSPSYDPLEIYRAGACPYEYLHALGRQGRSVILPHAYLASARNLQVVASLLEEVDLVLVDEVHNLLSLAEVSGDLEYSGQACSGEGEVRLCLLLPLAARLLRGRPVVAASASVTPPFSPIFVEPLGLRYVHVDRLPGEENLTVDIYPLEFRFRTRKGRRVVSRVVHIVERVYREYGRVMLFLPSREMADFYMRKLAHLPVTDRPANVDSVLVTYHGSPYAEGVSLDVSAAILAGFPHPDIRDRSLWIRMRLIRRMGYDGRLYGILFPAVSATVQAAGRATHGLDRGPKYVALLDDRFLEYRHLLPPFLTRNASVEGWR